MVLLLWRYLMTLSVISFTSGPNSQPFTIASASINQINIVYCNLGHISHNKTHLPSFLVFFYGKEKIQLLCSILLKDSWCEAKNKTFLFQRRIFVTWRWFARQKTPPKCHFVDCGPVVSPIKLYDIHKIFSFIYKLCCSQELDMWNWMSHGC